jgi:IclR family pca regulon transcriptional regulator
MNVSARASRGSSETIRRELLPPLRAAAAQMEADLSSGTLQGREA